MAELNLYAFRPDYHGPESFFVMASSKEHAVAVVDAHVQDMRQNGKSYETGEWPRDYTLEVAEFGEVLSNDNS